MANFNEKTALVIELHVVVSFFQKLKQKRHQKMFLESLFQILFEAFLLRRKLIIKQGSLKLKVG